MTELPFLLSSDQPSREEALDSTRSFLVQAPAGSGKTELLAMRFLTLLAEVEDPAQILAITFTMNATAEIQHRVLTRLEEARSFLASGVMPRGENSRNMQVAAAALANSERRGWRLLERPHRLNIQSIDALCLRITQQMPLSAEVAGSQRAKFAWPLYRKAAGRTFDRLGGADDQLNTALSELLLLRNNNLTECEGLLAGMLASREQWTRVFPLYGEIDWHEARMHLEAPFQREIYRVLGEAHALFSSDPELTRDLLRLANYSCENAELTAEIQLLAGSTDLPAALPDFVNHWQCLCKLILTQARELRKKLNTPEESSAGGPQPKGRKKNLSEKLAQVPGLVPLLCDILDLPPPHYSDEQWQALRHIFIALRHSVIELNTIFREENTTDFTEVGIAALKLLSERAAVPAFVQEVRHLLIDEFQDTSRRQYELVTSLLREWEREAGRTFFLVGDPMQSIYMFRQAEVELFNLVGREGFVTSRELFPPKTLSLSTNFRSHAGVVRPLNALFAVVFPHAVKAGAASVDFLPGVPGNPAEPAGAYQVHSSFLPSTARRGETDSRSTDTSEDLKAAAQQEEAAAVVAVIRRHLGRINQARENGEEFTVAILARAKKHLASIAAQLRAEGIAFRAVELEKLGERQEVLDLQSLTRALLHPRDRVAWLALLRAPWCGLALADLHLLCGTDENQFAGGAVATQMEARLHLAGENARLRVLRLLSVLQAAQRSRYRQVSLSSWIERTWQSLGGPACIDAAGRENTQAYFQMLDLMALDGIAATGQEMKEQLEQLFAKPDPSVSERCGVQLMTMHKAKGLGFNVVLLPGLHRATAKSEAKLVKYLERATAAGTELLAAPIDGTGEKGPLGKWVGKQRGNREAEERKRLLYVACTRAREELHLFATADVTKDGPRATANSLLHTAWPALERVFVSTYERRGLSIAQNPKPHHVSLSRATDTPEADVIEKIAASVAPTMLWRLPSLPEPPTLTAGTTASPAYSRPRSQDPARTGDQLHGSRFSRILGTVVHALFERAARMLETALLGEFQLLPKLAAYAVALARNEGLAPAEIEQCARLASSALDAALSDSHGRWILQAQAETMVESSWTGVIDGSLRTLRIDRSFRAGAEPLSSGEDYLWIVDYKTASHRKSGMQEFLAAEKLQYAGQLEAYGRMMRAARGQGLQLRFGLYYPLLQQLLWWSDQAERV